MPNAACISFVLVLTDLSSFWMLYSFVFVARAWTKSSDTNFWKYCSGVWREVTSSVRAWPEKSVTSVTWHDVFLWLPGLNIHIRWTIGRFLVFFVHREINIWFFITCISVVKIYVHITFSFLDDGNYIVHIVPRISPCWWHSEMKKIKLKQMCIVYTNSTHASLWRVHTLDWSSLFTHLTGHTIPNGSPIVDCDCNPYRNAFSVQFTTKSNSDEHLHLCQNKAPGASRTTWRIGQVWPGVSCKRDLGSQWDRPG